MKQRPRRTKVELERDVMETARSLVIEVGFSNITLVNLAKRSKVATNVKHDNFGNLESVLKLFVEKNRFCFLNAVAHATSSKDQSEINYLKKLISQLLQDSFDNKIVSQILKLGIGRK